MSPLLLTLACGGSRQKTMSTRHRLSHLKLTV
jgi:hypothetical protein